MPPTPSAAAGDLFSRNLVHFARVLRRAGLRVGPAAVLDGLAVLAALDLGRRDDVKAGLRAVFVHRPEELPTFDQAFDQVFRAPTPPGLAELMSLLLPQSQVPAPTDPAVSRRVAEALQAERPPAAQRLPPRPARRPDGDDRELDAAMTFSARETLRHRDFAEMSAEELRQARALVAGLRPLVQPQPIRRTRPARRGPSLDLPAMLRRGLREAAWGGPGHGAAIPLRFRQRRREVPPLCILCDISGSMARYTEMLLRFIHALAQSPLHRRVACFLFGTRLSNVSRLLAGRDVDVALGRIGRAVGDWGGGTRLGPCLRDFNLRWSRRVLAERAVVLLITDGLERDDAVDLGAEARRLHGSCRRLIWLNPLLGFDGFQPRAQGIRALLPHVDEHRPVHNLESLDQLAAALGR